MILCLYRNDKVRKGNEPSSDRVYTSPSELAR